MASLFKLRITRYVNQHGARVSKGSPGAKVVREKSRKWYGEYKDENETLQRVPLTTDKAAAQAMLNELVRKAERKASGLFDPFEEHAKRLLKDHIAEYEAFMTAKNNSEQHVAQTLARIRKLVSGCSFRHLAEIEAPKVATWLATQRTTKKRFSSQTAISTSTPSSIFATGWLPTNVCRGIPSNLSSAFLLRPTGATIEDRSVKKNLFGYLKRRIADQWYRVSRDRIVRCSTCSRRGRAFAVASFRL
jgi:hypothetical protein